MTIPVLMLMCDKVTNTNQKDNRLLFQKISIRQISVNLLICLFLGNYQN